ncbi:MAG TPA: neutral zinc metallopeptidase [Acidimicrobiia bacterium]|nr:neutral zinc metallopeptidase [Acidimicrobiia bacterium]
MVRYRKAPQNPNIQDRRGMGGSRTGRRVALGGGGIGLGTLAIILLLNVCAGGGLGDLGGLAGELVPVDEPPRTPLTTISPANDPDAELKEYMEAVYADNDLLWQDVFAQAGRQDYQSPQFVFFEGFTDSGCGGADERVGPHYCPLDGTMYLDFTFFTQLREQFGARGDLAPAYVISHEFGHHIQTLLGISEQVRGLQQENPGQANDLSIAMELQADCFAGVWLSTVSVDPSGGEVDEGFIEIDPGELREAMEAAQAVGDDRIQAQATGMVNPETWTHGSAEQRSEWLQRGIDSGDPGQCDTFSQLG